MKYEQINAQRMNEYLGYMKTILTVYRDGGDLPEYAFQQYKEWIEEMQTLNLEMEKIPAKP